MRKFILTLILSIAALNVLAEDKPKPPVFTALSAQSKAELAHSRILVSGLVSRKDASKHLTQTAKDFEILQALAEDPAMKKSGPNVWIAMGVAFGDALIAYIPGLSWWDVQDEYGPGIVLRYKLTTMTLAAPDMIIKRVERGESFDLSFMANGLKKYVQENADQVQ